MYFGFRNISVAYGKNKILENITLGIGKGEFVTLAGKNGCGKSSLLKTFSGAVKPISGDVVFEDKSLRFMERKEIAKRIAYLPQFNTVPEGIDVRTLVSYGRYPHRNFGRGLTAVDMDIVDGALASAGLTCLADREVQLLSGGERQRAWIAMILSRQPEIMILDEPAAHLDIGYQLDVLDLIAELSCRHGITVLAVLHDLNLAARYSDRIALINERKLYDCGKPRDIITEENLERVFGISAHIIEDEHNGCPYLIPLSDQTGHM